MKRKRLRKVYDNATYKTIIDWLKTSEEAHQKIIELYWKNKNINYKLTCYDEKYENDLFIENYKSLLHKYFIDKKPTLLAIMNLQKEFRYIQSYIDIENCDWLIDNYNKYRSLLPTNKNEEWNI